MNDNEENLFKALAEFQWPDPPTIFYRLYHDDLGKPLIYTMEDLPGTYIEISREDFLLASMNCQIVNGKIVRQVNTYTAKLIPGDSGVPCHPDSVAVVVSETQPNIKWSYRQYA